MIVKSKDSTALEPGDRIVYSHCVAEPRWRSDIGEVVSFIELPTEKYNFVRITTNRGRFAAGSRSAQFVWVGDSL